MSHFLNSNFNGYVNNFDISNTFFRFFYALINSTVNIFAVNLINFKLYLMLNDFRKLS
jgi:hypothetical protein